MFSIPGPRVLPTGLLRAGDAARALLALGPLDPDGFPRGKRKLSVCAPTRGDPPRRGGDDAARVSSTDVDLVFAVAGRLQPESRGVHGRFAFGGNGAPSRRPTADGLGLSPALGVPPARAGAGAVRVSVANRLPLARGVPYGPVETSLLGGCLATVLATSRAGLLDRRWHLVNRYTVAGARAAEPAAVVRSRGVCAAPSRSRASIPANGGPGDGAASLKLVASAARQRLSTAGLPGARGVDRRPHPPLLESYTTPGESPPSCQLRALPIFSPRIRSVTRHDLVS